MKYSRTALKVLKAQYFSVLKKCALINAGLFFLAAPAMADVVDVEDFNKFIEALRDYNISEINLKDDLTATEATYLHNNTSEVTINGGGHNFNGDGNEGIIVNSGQKLKISNVGDVSDIDTEKPNGFHGFVSNEDGGAIFNGGTLTITASKFSDNSTSRGGGAIYSLDTVTVTDSVFSGNSALYNGGAIYTDHGTLEVTNSDFRGNSAAGWGGAIGNGSGGTLNIVADKGNTTFTGNTMGKGGNEDSNALYNYGTANLNAGEHKIVFNDGIDGSDNGTININQSGINLGNGVLAPTNGIVEFNNLAQNNTVNLYGGTLKLGHFAGDTIDGKQVASSNGDFNNSVNFNVHGGKLDLADGEIRNVNLGNMTLFNDLKLGIDANSSSVDVITADKFDAQGNKILLSGIDLGMDENYNGTAISDIVDIFNNVALADDLKVTGTQAADKNFLVSYNTTNGNLSAGASTLKNAVTATGDRTYTMNTDEDVDEDLGTKGGTSLTINGNKFDINGNQYQGIKVEAGQSLNINGVGDIDKDDSKGFNGFYPTKGTFLSESAIENSGTLTIDKSVFSGNSSGFNFGGAIRNSSGGTLTVIDSIFKDNDATSGGAISNVGTLNIVANEKDTAFTGNTMGAAGNKKPNALYNSGTANLNAGNYKIVFNDRIDSNPLSNGEDYINKGTININQSGIDLGSGISAPTSGIVEFNNGVAINTVNLYGGTLKLGHYTYTDTDIVTNGKVDNSFLENTTSYGNFDSSVDFNVHGGKLDLADDKVRDVNLGNVTLENDLELAIDADLANGQADKITASSQIVDNGHNIVITDVNILSDSQNLVTRTQIADDNLKSAVKLSSDPFEANGKDIDKSYLLAYENTNGVLTFDAATTLKKAVEATDTQRVYSLKADEDVAAPLNRMGGTNSTLTINGYGKNINGNGNEGIIVNSGQKLKISNVGDVSDKNSGGFNGFESYAGGAIYNDYGTLEVTDSVFSDNSARLGGAILNGGTLTVTGSKFSGNFANEVGGAILNQGGDITVENSVFSGNKAYGFGGAISNQGALTIVADKKNTTFTGNTTNNISNALYNSGGTANLNAGEHKIVFNDGIDGRGTININQSGVNLGNDEFAPTSGVVEFNNEVKGNTVNLYSGTLKLGHYTYTDTDIVTNDKVDNSFLLGQTGYGDFDDTVNFNVKGNNDSAAIFGSSVAKLDLADGNVRETNLGKLTLESNLNLGIDVALADAKADTIKANSVKVLNDSKINLSDFNLLNDANKNITEVTVTGDSDLYDAVSLAKTNISVGDNVQQNYLITYNDGKLKFGKDQTLQTAIQFNTQEDRAYAMGSSETLSEDLGALAGTSLTISSNGQTVDGNGYQGVSVADGQTLSLQNTSFTNFSGVVVDNSGTLELKADNHDMAIDGDISGTDGKIVVSGQKTVALNGTVSGNDVNLQSGVLALGNDTVLVNAGKFKAEGGTLDVGVHNVTAGDATFESGSTLAVTVNPNAHGLFHADNLTVKDGANLKATLAQGLVGRGEEKGLQLVSAANDWDDNFILAHDNNMYKFEKGNTAGEYIVTLAQTAEDVVQKTGGTQNNANAAEAWVDGDKFPAGTNAQALADRLAGLAQNNAPGFNDALTALAPEVAPVVKTAAVDHSNQIFNAVSTRMSGGSVGSAAEGMSSGDSQSDGGATWVQLLANKTKFDGNRKAHGFDSKSAGLAMGAEKQIDERTKAGVGYAYTSSDIDSFRRDIDVDTHTVFAYGEYKPSNWFVNGVASYSFSDYDESKNVAGSRYKAKYDVDNFGLQVMTGYDTMLGKAEFTPMAGLRYNRIHRDSYKDSADQLVSSDNMDVLTAVMGAKIYKNFITCGGTHWKPEARLAMTYDLVSDKENAVVGLLNGSSYFVEGERLNRFGIEAGLGLTVDVSDKVETSVGYEGRFREDYTDHTGMISAKYKF